MGKKKNPYGNVDDTKLKIKKALPEAARFTEPDQNRKIRQRGN